MSAWILTGIAVLLAGNTSAPAKADNPYASITRSNVFKLRPVLAQPQSTPPLITRPIFNLLGIVYVNEKQAILRVTRGESAQTTTYTLSQGQKVDNIEMRTVNPQSGTVQLRYQGRDQTLSLENDGLKPGDSQRGSIPRVTHPPQGVVQ